MLVAFACDLVADGWRGGSYIRPSSANVSKQSKRSVKNMPHDTDVVMEEKIESYLGNERYLLWRLKLIVRFLVLKRWKSRLLKDRFLFDLFAAMGTDPFSPWTTFFRSPFLRGLLFLAYGLDKA
ncbi:MAG: hypothetical protein LBB43_06505 [Spirochaetaceae bacterium]|nr:hypothetical protein [Spirochaetaceae bacterium]